MGANKKRYTAGERTHPIPAHGGMYRMSDETGYYWLGQGPRPQYRPTPDELRKHGITTEPIAEPVADRPKQGTLF